MKNRLLVFTLICTLNVAPAKGQGGGANGQISFINKALLSAGAHKKNECSPSDCPKVLKSWVKDDQHGLFWKGYGSTTILQQCHHQRLSTDPLTSTELFDEFQATEALKVATPNKSVLYQCQLGHELTQVQKKSLVSNYIYGLNKLDSGIEGHLTELAGINNLLGEKFSKNSVCKNPSLRRAYRVCNNYVKACKKNNQKNWGQFSSEAKVTFNKVQATRAQVRLILRKIPAVERKKCLRAATENKHCKSYYALKDILENTINKNAWMKSKVFSKNLKKIGFEGSLKKQFKFNKRELLKSIAKKKNAAQCLNGLSSKTRKANREKKCNLKDTLNEIETSPQITLTPKKGRSFKKQYSAVMQIENVMCLDERRKDRNNTRSILGHSALSVASLAIPALGARGLFLTLKAARIMVMPVDGFYASHSLKEAQKNCSQKMDLKSLTKKSSNKCPSVIENNPVIQKYDSCIQSALFAALDGLPLIPAGLLKQLNMSKRFGISKAEVSKNSRLTSEGRVIKAEDLLRKKLGRSEALSKSQREGLIEAHNVGKGELGKKSKSAEIFNYTNKQLARKLKILLRAGFSKKEAELLLESGLAGKKKMSSKQRKSLERKIKKEGESPKNNATSSASNSEAVAGSTVVSARKTISEKVVSSDEVIDFIASDTTADSLQSIKKFNPSLGDTLENFYDVCEGGCSQLRFETYKHVLSDIDLAVTNKDVHKIISQCFGAKSGSTCPDSELELVNTLLDSKVTKKGFEFTSEITKGCGNSCPSKIFSGLSQIISRNESKILNSKPFRKRVELIASICSDGKNASCKDYLDDFHKISALPGGNQKLGDFVKMASRCLKFNKAPTNCKSYGLIKKLKLAHPQKIKSFDGRPDSAPGNRNEINWSKEQLDKSSSDYVNELDRRDLELQYSDGDLLNKYFFDLEHAPAAKSNSVKKLKIWEKLREDEGIASLREPDYIIKVGNEKKIYDYYNPRLNRYKFLKQEISDKIVTATIYKVVGKRQTNGVIINIKPSQDLVSKSDLRYQLIKASAKLRGATKKKQKFTYPRARIEKLSNPGKERLGYVSSPESADTVTVEVMSELVEDVIVLMGRDGAPMPVRIFPYFDDEAFEAAYDLYESLKPTR